MADVRTLYRQIVGVLAALDFFTLRAQKNRNEFLIKILQKQHQKSIKVLKELTVCCPAVYCQDRLG